MSLVPQSHEISVCSPGTRGLWTRPAAPVIRVSHPCCVTFLCLVSVTTAQTWPHRPKGDGCRKERGYESSTPGASPVIIKLLYFHSVLAPTRPGTEQRLAELCSHHEAALQLNLVTGCQRCPAAPQQGPVPPAPAPPPWRMMQRELVPLMLELQSVQSRREARP